MIEVQGIRKRFGEGDKTTDALRGVTLHVPTGDFYTILGPSGCGKTTLLRCIAGLEMPDEGEITLGDRLVFSASRGINVPTFRRRFGMVFQSYAVWPHLTTFGNVAFPLTTPGSRLPASEVRARVQAMLAMVGLDNLGDRPATQLSGGQQQRLAFARAVIAEPVVLLLDEPLSNLDANLREQMRRELRRLQQRLGLTAVYVTHDQGEALALSDRVAVMNQGRVVQEGTPLEIYRSPRSRFVAQFVGAANIVSGQAGAMSAAPTLDCALGSLVLPAGRGETAAGAVAIRPEEIALFPERPALPNVFPAVVRERQFLGFACEYQIACDGQVLLAQTPGTVWFEPGATVFAHIPPSACLPLADAEGGD